jgi:hypothetical protein
MRKSLIIGIGLLGMALMGSMCESGGGGGGGGGLFSVSAMTKNTNAWDFFFGLTTNPSCPQSFAERGASFLDLPGGLYQGAVVVDNGGQLDGYIPENFILGYQVFRETMVVVTNGDGSTTEVMQSPVQPGDAVTVHFRYQVNADGLASDYFRTRIIDGNFFHEPASAYFGTVTANIPLESNFTYVSSSNNFGLEFIVGLHGPADKFYLDDVVVLVNGATLFEDQFEGGDYTLAASMSASVLRTPLVPAQMIGSFAPQNTVVLEGANSLGITGGSYFDLYGQSGISGINTVASITYTGTDTTHPLYGQSQALLQNGVFVGNYQAWNQPVYNPNDLTYCAETGQVLIGTNLSGSANLAGVWDLTLANVTCMEALDGASIVINQYIPGIQVARMLNFFMSYPFPFGQTPAMMLGLSMGRLGLMQLTPAMMGEGTLPVGLFGAQLVGVYYPEAPEGFPFPVPPGKRVFTGTVMGTLPTGSGTCTVTGGNFVAWFDDTVFVPPPLPMP